MGSPAGAGGFEEFFARFGRSLLRQAYVLSGDAQEAQDLTQETLLRVWREWDKVSGLDDPAAWSRRVLHNLAVSRWRRLRTSRLATGPLRPGGSRAADAGHLDVARAVRSLPANQRRALVLRSVVGMSAAEVALEMGTTEATVRSWLTRARATVAARLDIGKAYPGESAPGRGGDGHGR